MTTRYDRMRAAADELKLQAMKAPGASVERVTCLTLHDQLRADADELEREIEALREALRMARQWIVFDAAPLGWNVDRIDAAIAKERGT